MDTKGYFRVGDTVGYKYDGRLLGVIESFWPNGVVAVIKGPERTDVSHISHLFRIHAPRWWNLWSKYDETKAAH